MGDKTYSISRKEEFVYQVEDVFKEYYAPLCYFAARYVNDEIAVEDLVEDLFASLLEKKQYFQSELHLKNYLYISVKLQR